MGRMNNAFAFGMRGSITIFGIIFLWIGLMFLFSALLMWLWNITMTRIFGLKEITFWEAFRLILIAGILFGGSSIFKINF